MSVVEEISESSLLFLLPFLKNLYLKARPSLADPACTRSCSFSMDRGQTGPESKERILPRSQVHTPGLGLLSQCIQAANPDGSGTCSQCVGNNFPTHWEAVS